jgi:hypothetical protein
MRTHHLANFGTFFHWMFDWNVFGILFETGTRGAENLFNVLHDQLDGNIIVDSSEIWGICCLGF